jgi:hypothetical protein
METESSCIPASKYDVQAVYRARALGYPALNDLLPQLLEWLLDVNWPVAQHVASLLSLAGREIVPHIKAVFSSDDPLWKYSLFASGLIRDLAPAVHDALRDDLVRMATQPTDAERVDEVDLMARQTLEAWEKRTVAPSGGNMLAAALALLRSQGYAVAAETGDSLLRAEKGGQTFAAEDPLLLLGLVKLHETRGVRRHPASREAPDYLSLVRME